jgi:hypothetical protein
LPLLGATVFRRIEASPLGKKLSKENNGKLDMIPTSFFTEE